MGTRWTTSKARPQAGKSAALGAKRRRRGGIIELQRRRIFALARRHGLTLDDVRAMTPAGSVSELTKAQADALIRRLGGVVPGRGSKATPGQLTFVRDVARSVGFDDASLSAWLSRTFGVDAIERIPDRDAAAAVITGLLALQRQKAELPRPGRRVEG
jgi:hypothetical protein